MVDGAEVVLLPAPGAAAFFGVTDPDDAAWMDERLTAHPWRTFEQKLELTNEDALWAIPQYHIVCTSTLATRDPELMGKAREAGRLWDIDTGHDLMVTEPDFVARTLQEIARRRDLPATIDRNKPRSMDRRSKESAIVHKPAHPRAHVDRAEWLTGRLTQSVRPLSSSAGRRPLRT